MPGLPEYLVLCLGCHRHVRRATRRCPHCGADVRRLAQAEQKQLDKVLRLTARLERILAGRAPQRP